MTGGVSGAIVFGVSLGLLYGVAGFLNFRWAMRRDGASFMVIALGGMIVRMTVMFIFVALGVLLLHVQEDPFFLAFFLTFMIVLAIEITAMHKGWGIKPTARPERLSDKQSE